MKSLRITVVMTVFVLSLGILTLFMTAVSNTLAAPAEQSGVSPERAEEEAARPGESFGPDDTGGPDAYGYTFIDSNEPDGPIYNFVEISSTGTAFPLPDSAITGPLSLGFDFNYYGTVFTEVSAVSNGYLWFDNGTAHVLDSTPDCPLPNTFGNENYIAVLHDDLDGQQNLPNGMGYYQAFAPGFCPYGGYGGACFIVEWDGTYHDGTTDDLTFQVILFDDDRFLMQYQDAGNEAGSASTTGIENTDATIALTYACDAANTITDNLAILYEELSGPFYGDSTKNGPAAIVAGDPITYTLVISNSGTSSGTNTVLTDAIPAGTTFVPGSLTCDGGTGICSYSAGTVNWAGSIEAGEAVTVEFAVDTTSTVCGGVITNLATITDPDAFGSPTELEMTTGIWDNLLLYDFEADDGGFVPGFSGFPGPSDWEWGVPTAPPDLGATSGTNVWATILDGLHNNNNGSSLLTKTVDLTGFSDSAQLSWSHYLQANNSGFDFATVNVNGDEVFSSFGDTDTPDWTTQSVPVGAYAGGSAEIVFDFFATAGTNDFGWYIDDVTIASCDPPDAPVFDDSSKSAPDTAFSDDVYTYTVSINNTGGVTATNVVMTDAIPAGTTYVPGSATNGATYNSGLNQIEWTGTVSATTSVDVSFMVTATLASGVVTNTAVISHTDIMTPVEVSAVTTVVGATSYPVCADFETGSLPSYFYTETTSNGAANGRVAVTTAFPHTGSWAMDLDTDCDNCGGNTQQAAIMIVDLAGQSGVSLDFWVFEHADESNPEDGVFISDDGGATWALIQSLNGFPSNYVQVTLDLDAATANAGMSYVDDFLIRFQSLDGATIPGNDGYSFDDICVEPGQPEITVNPADLSSTQAPNEVVTQSLTINNPGSAVLNWNITEAGSACDTPAPVPWANAIPSSGTTNAGGSTLVNVGFDSTGLSPAVYNGLLCVNSDDPVTPVVTVTLTLTVEVPPAAPAIAIAPTSLASTQGVNTQVTQTLTISNVGDADLHWNIVEQDSGANFESTLGADARQITDPADAGIEFDTAAAAGVSINPVGEGYVGPTFAPESFVLHDNGPLVNSPGTGVGGADESVLQTTSLGMNTLGFGHALSALDRAADDFTIPAGDTWELDQITFFAYQTGSTTASTITGVNLQIWDGEPGNGGTIIWGDTTTNILVNTVWTGIYRVTETTTGSAVDRPIMANTVDLGGLVLPAGTYWLDWQTDGTLASGPWAPPITINGVAVTGNGLGSGDNGTTWAPALDSGTGTPQQGFPFIIEGTPGCAAGDIPWVTVSPTSGTTAPADATDVDVIFDSTGLTGGVYTGTLCVTSDDPVTPLVEVPLSLTVENAAPVAVGDSYTTTQDMGLSVPAPGVLDNDSDPDGDELTAVLDTDVSDGSLTLNADGSFTYTPDPGFSGTDSFTYHANDGTADSNTVTVTIEVIVTEYTLYMPIVRKADTTQAHAVGEGWGSVALAAFPMMLGMWVVVRRNGRFDG